MVSFDSDIIVTRSVAHEPHLKELLPCVTNWPRDAPASFYDSVSWRYFLLVDINRFHYAILLHKSESLRDALQAFSREGAFATRMGREALLGVIGEARNTEWCKDKAMLDELARYAAYAFVLDGVVMTCGAIE